MASRATPRVAANALERRVEDVAAHHHEAPVEVRLAGDDRVEDLDAGHAGIGGRQEHRDELLAATRADRLVAVAAIDRRRSRAIAERLVEERPDRRLVVEHEDPRRRSDRESRRAAVGARAFAVVVAGVGAERRTARRRSASVDRGVATGRSKVNAAPRPDADGP